MMKQSGKSMAPGCPVWAGKTHRLLGLAGDDPERLEWESHARECRLCGGVLADEASFQRALLALPDPGPARVADDVMRRVRSVHTRPLFRPRELAWGLAGSVAGVLIGLLMASTAPGVNGMTREPQAQASFTELSDEIDALTLELAADDETGGQR